MLVRSTIVSLLVAAPWLIAGESSGGGLSRYATILKAESSSDYLRTKLRLSVRPGESSNLKVKGTPQARRVKLLDNDIVTIDEDALIER
ncbi:hypothetical protein SAMN06296036_1524 [Pseudobacteriovorax antillogorgiicola]|uniref:Uncharacterized protein n=2 Tax=Pseudobacteriovorax antillogorgiicola TaxID=1513793 RepID=A0A1Y6CZ40_9BACT|nr:hypothetical protein EDD56_15210 [Pseudobacteriovorax antillogorgiicola]SMF84087.1 hypothetical protein SAMN06296036_1524 [Pseudobacteriovorax antillogorgiicola]